jgi:hypothetical protein
VPWCYKYKDDTTVLYSQLNDNNFIHLAQWCLVEVEPHTTVMADRPSDTFLHGKSSDVRRLSYLMADRLSDSFQYGKSSDVCLSYFLYNFHPVLKKVVIFDQTPQSLSVYSFWLIPKVSRPTLAKSCISIVTLVLGKSHLYFRFLSRFTEHCMLINFVVFVFLGIIMYLLSCTTQHR